MATESQPTTDQAGDLLDASTFVFPPPLSGPTITIEFCDRVSCISLYPRNTEDTAGRFRVWLSLGSEEPALVWDRKIEGGFPELKNLVSIITQWIRFQLTLGAQKQRVRDRVQPGKSLGHSDKTA
ncbi:hypothetical protein BD779DRAFT_1490004 [Infundibulicybe gibba]|nr:hypothetical protein BD779DRAFT_1490004 [Infundibulicybe gibba]